MSPSPLTRRTVPFTSRVPDSRSTSVHRRLRASPSLKPLAMSRVTRSVPSFHWHLLDAGVDHVRIKPRTPRLNGEWEYYYSTTTGPTAPLAAQHPTKRLRQKAQDPLS
jgi:hypothetical protein